MAAAQLSQERVLKAETELSLMMEFQALQQVSGDTSKGAGAAWHSSHQPGRGVCGSVRPHLPLSALIGDPPHPASQALWAGGLPHPVLRPEGEAPGWSWALHCREPLGRWGAFLQDPSISLKGGSPPPPSAPLRCTVPRHVDAQLPLACLPRRGAQLEGLEIPGIFYFFFVSLCRLKISTVKSFIQQAFTEHLLCARHC